MSIAHPPRTGRPVVAVDVDGVLNPHDPQHAARHGYRPHHYDGTDPDGQPATGVVWLHPAHGVWLTELAATADLVWCTSWRHRAADWLAPRLGLPDLPVIDVPHRSGVRFGHQIKLGALYAWVADRPVAVLDDEFGGKDRYQATERTRTGLPTLHLQVDGTLGLQRSDIDQVTAWLHSLHNAHPTATSSHDGAETGPLSVGDPATMKTRLLSRMCSTCVFRAGNAMHLSPGRLQDLVAEARADESYIVCHSTLPGMAPPGVQPAICRGFADRYSTQSLQVIERIFGFTAVDPPDHEPSQPGPHP